MSFFKFFRKNKRPKMHLKKNHLKKKPSKNLAKEFTNKRTKNIKFIFSKTRFKFSLFWKKLIAFSAIISVVLLIIFFIFLGNFLTVQHIQLTRQDFRADISEISPFLEPYRGKNIFSLSKKEIELNLKEKFPQIEEIKIKKILPKTIRVSIKTFPIVALWEIEVKKLIDIKEEEITLEKDSKPQKQTVFINKIGKVCDGTEKDKSAFLIQEKDLHRSFLKISEKVISEKKLTEIISSKEMLEEILNMVILKAEFFRKGKEIHFIAEDGMKIWIDFFNNPKKQIQKLHHVLAETEILKEKISYFDLRIDGKIIWKK